MRPAHHHTRITPPGGPAGPAGGLGMQGKRGGGVRRSGLAGTERRTHPARISPEFGRLFPHLPSAGCVRRGRARPFSPVEDGGKTVAMCMSVYAAGPVLAAAVEWDDP